MLIKYEMPVRFSVEDFTSPGCVNASTLLHLFQKIAVAHAESAGLGFDDLIKHDLIWVVTKLKYKALADILPDTEYRLVTYPMPNGSLMYQRDFYIYSPDGTPAVIASSQWCIINFLTRHVEQVSVGFDGEYYDKSAFDSGIERIRPRGLIQTGSHVVTKDDLDENDHTNNCRYADMALDILGVESISEFTINFAKETRLGDRILLFTSPDGTVAGKLEDGTLVFAVAVKHGNSM